MNTETIRSIQALWFEWFFVFGKADVLNNARETLLAIWDLEAIQTIQSSGSLNSLNSLGPQAEPPNYSNHLKYSNYSNYSNFE